MTINVAIIGSGPAGYYTAEALVNTGEDVRIDVIDRLPTPFGLIRSGVAPDHQTTKNVEKKFAKTALREEVQFYGNVEIGNDLCVDELCEIYDAVVLAIGASMDKLPPIPGADKKGSYGAATFVGWYNGHPDHLALKPDLSCDTVCVIGHGNVGMDIARVLTKTDDELKITDMPDYARNAIVNSSVKNVHLVGRRGPLQAKFTNPELREMGGLAECVPLVDGDILPDEIPEGEDAREHRLQVKNIDRLKEYAANKAGSKPKACHFDFFRRPVEILGDDKVTGLRVEKTIVDADGQAQGTGEFYDIPCGIVVSAIGYRTQPISCVPFDEKRGTVESDNGRIKKGLYVVGWAKRGPSGVISSNRPDGEICAEQIMEDVPDGGKPGREAFRKLLEGKGARRVSFADWQKIDEAEHEMAEHGAPRHKLVTVDEVLDVLDHMKSEFSREVVQKKMEEA